MQEKDVIIIGGGPAGLTAAYELLKLKKGYRPILLEELEQVGGISKTINYKGNRMDIGGHRFFSKSDVVMDWWQAIMPIEKMNNVDDVTITYRNQSRTLNENQRTVIASEIDDNVMLIRSRLSRIFYLRKFFDYPIKINVQTVANLGIPRITRIVLSYMRASLFPIKDEKSLEDFFINRFGRELYSTFFRDYTEKVWGVPCNQIKPEWGSQRIKGLSITTAILHFAKSLIKSNNSISQKDTETSLIERFMYPKFGPGQLWEIVKDSVLADGGELHYHEKVIKITTDGTTIKNVVTTNLKTNEEKTYEGNYFISTMPVKDLINALQPITGAVPQRVKEVANSLIYRDFITVGLLLNKLKIKNKDTSNVLDNWIYIQESDVKIGRLQVFNNWSPFMVADATKTWLGLEYFCSEGDELWLKSEDEMKTFAAMELAKIGIIDFEDVVDAVVVKVPKTYPAYIGGYENFDEVRTYTDTFHNLFLVGRNGMHKYNNQDHSMLTAINAVHNISEGIITKDNIWAVNTEDDYHEEK